MSSELDKKIQAYIHSKKMLGAQRDGVARVTAELNAWLAEAAEWEGTLRKTERELIEYAAALHAERSAATAALIEPGPTPVTVVT